MEKLISRLSQIAGVSVHPNKKLKIHHISVDGEKVLSFKSENGNFRVFPYHRYFDNAKTKLMNLEDVIKLIANKTEVGV